MTTGLDPHADLGDDEYVRLPIPDAALVRSDKSTAALRDLAVEHAALLVLVPPASCARAETLARAFDWSSRLSRVGVRPVLPDPWRPNLPPGVPDDVLFDPERRLSEIFRTAEQPAAVLLGGGRTAGGRAGGRNRRH